MKIRLFIIISIALSAFYSNALTINSVLDSIAVNNTELKARSAETQSKIAAIKATNNLGDTEIGFEYQKGDNIDGKKYGFSISQGFEWPGIYIARTKANKSQISASEFEYLSKKLEILLNAKQLCLKIINSNRKIKTQTEIYNNIKQLYDEYEKGFKHGEISILDINKLRIELLNVKQALHRSITERSSFIEMLTCLNGNNAISGIESVCSYPDQELHSIETYENHITTLDPEYNLNNAVLSSSEKEVSIAKMGWLPKFSVGYKYANELGDKFNGVDVGISLPIFSNRNNVSRAKAAKSALLYTSQDVLNSKISQVKADYSQVVYLKEQVYSYNLVLSDSSNTEMLKKALNGGQITLLNYLMELRYFLDAQQSLLDLEYEYNSVLTSLNKYQLL